MTSSWLPRSVFTAALVLLAPQALAHGQDGTDDNDGPALRAHAGERVEWRKAGPRSSSPVKVRLLGFNDFHGQLSGRFVGARPAGGAAVLASYLKAAQVGMEDRTFIVHAGDHVGASPPNSALLQDEPAISFLNLIANRHCQYLDHWGRLGLRGDECEDHDDDDDHFEEWLSPRCNVLGVTGNHEFDEGFTELRRLLEGGNHPTGPFLENPWRGARYPTVVANVVDTLTRRPVLPPYVIKRVDGVPVAFIGLVLAETPTIVTPTGVAGLSFVDEADAANRIIRRLQRRGVHAFVVVIHKGGFQTPSFATPTGPAPGAGSDFVDIQNVITRLNDDVDVVVSGHRHSFTNTLLPTASGKQVLVTQAFSATTAYAQIDLELDRRTRDVVSKSAIVPTTWGDTGPGLTPDPAVAAMTAAADARVAPLVNRVVGTAAGALNRAATLAGEHTMGNVIADAQRAAVPGAVAAFMNPGGVRADLDAGSITWGELFTIQPFGNSLVAMTLTGDQVKTLLEQQWVGQTSPRILQVSGITYSWSASAPNGSKVSDIAIGGVAVSPTATYRVVVNNFIAAGGDNFVVLRSGLNQVGGDIDLDALINYVTAQPGAVLNVPTLGRITRLP